MGQTDKGQRPESSERNQAPSTVGVMQLIKDIQERISESISKKV